MKKIIFKITFVINFLCLLSSCEKEITLNLPDYESKIVINRELNTNDFIQVEISKSIPIMKKVDSTGYLLTDATAKLYEDNIFKGTMQYAQLMYEYPLKPLPGKTYRIEVSRTGFPTASVEVKIPDAFLTTYIYDDSVGLDNSGLAIGQLSVSFKDDGSTSNYYQLGIRFYNSSVKNWLPLAMEINDPVIINNKKLNDGSYIFSDATFNGQLKTMLFPITPTDVSSTPGIDKFEISIKTFSSEYYKYMQQVRDYQPKSDPFVTDPIILGSNVSNGLGMVGAVYNNKDTLR